MKNRKQTDSFPFPRDFRKQGSITYQGTPVDLWVSRKTGELGFSIRNKAVSEPELYSGILKYLQSANRES